MYLRIAFTRVPPMNSTAKISFDRNPIANCDILSHLGHGFFFNCHTSAQWTHVFLTV